MGEGSIKGVWLGDWKDGNATNRERPQEDERVGQEESSY